MGKAPEKGITQGGPARYRRKSFNRESHARQVRRGSDNQLEHRVPEPVDTKSGVPGKDIAREVDPDVPNTGQSNPVLDPELGEKQTSSTKARSSSVETSSSSAKSKPYRRRKQQYRGNNAGNHGRPNPLLKQLMWKAKPVAQQDAGVPAPSEVASTAASTTVEIATPNADTTGVPDGNSADTDAEEQEEREFAANERNHLKLEAVQTVLASCPACPMETSSQETQSGSEDDEPAYLPFVNLVSAGMRSPAPPVVSDVSNNDTDKAECFPVPLPLNQLRQLENDIRVHEIVVDNFAFHPREIQVPRGDVIVWKVSKETPGMVEHCLDVVWKPNDGGEQMKTSTPPLRAGDAYAWRFADAGRALIRCSVYDAEGVVLVGSQPEPRQEKSNRTRKLKFKRSYRKREFVKAPASAEDALAPGKSAEYAGDENAEDDDHVYHPPQDRTSALPSDPQVCREVLSQLEQVTTGNPESPVVIMIGDVECPVKTLIADNDGVGSSATHEQNLPSVPDFQQQVVAMLQRSEQMQLRHRRSFHVEASGFNADAAYEFFKRRFSQLQEQDNQPVYAERVVAVEPRTNRRGRAATMTLADVLARLTSG